MPKSNKGKPILSDHNNEISKVFYLIQEAIKLSKSVVSMSKDSFMSLGLHLKRRPNFLVAMVVVFVAATFLMQVSKIIFIIKSICLHLLIIFILVVNMITCNLHLM